MFKIRWFWFYRYQQGVHVSSTGYVCCARSGSCCPTLLVPSVSTLGFDRRLKSKPVYVFDLSLPEPSHLIIKVCIYLNFQARDLKLHESKIFRLQYRKSYAGLCVPRQVVRYIGFILLGKRYTGIRRRGFRTNRRTPTNHHSQFQHRENLNLNSKNARTITSPPPGSWPVEECLRRIFNINCT